ncbi:uncharacterized protein VTP21DRAFT_7082 [Calcarisporiella thermophila]|uniref:uncharacterized protein n=1 Tax=Calcarisporiella thermophila TaxID=911321 RepID=UPI00374421CE
MPPSKPQSPATQANAVEKRRRVKQACRACHQKKQKCDGNVNGCSRCLSLGIQCTFGSDKFRRGRPRNHFLQQNERILFDLREPSECRAYTSGSLLERLRRFIVRLDEFSELKTVSFNPTIGKSIWEWRWARGMRFTRNLGTNVISNDMLSILVEKMSSLSMGEKVEKSFPLHLINAADDFTVMDFSYSDPLKSISYHQAMTLIHTWFRLHPFPTILNRSIMIKNYSEQRMDRFLYAVVFGYAINKAQIPIFNQTKSGLPGSVFLEYAISLLENETPEPSLTKLQGLFILALQMVNMGQSKRGIPLTIMAWRMAMELRIPDQDSPLFGEELDPFERELRNNIWWAMRITLTWSMFHLGRNLTEDMISAQLKLPVKNEKESVLFELDQKHGYFTAPDEYAHVLRSFYNSAYLAVIMSEVWLHVIPSPAFRSLFDPLKSLPMAQEPVLSQKNLSTVCSNLSRLMNAIPPDLEPMGAAELLLYLNILIIHLHFPKSNNNLLFFLEEGVLECITSADMIVNLSEIVLEHPDSLPLHSIVAFGLNTSSCVHILIAESGTPERREEALLNLRRTLRLLESGRLVCGDVKLLRTLEEMLARAESGESIISRTANATDQNDDLPITPVVIPRVSLGLLANVKMADEAALPQSTLTGMLVRSQKKSSPEDTAGVSSILSSSIWQQQQQGQQQQQPTSSESVDPSLGVAPPINAPTPHSYLSPTFEVSPSNSLATTSNVYGNVISPEANINISPSNMSETIEITTPDAASVNWDNQFMHSKEAPEPNAEFLSSLIDFASGPNFTNAVLEPEANTERFPSVVLPGDIGSNIVSESFYQGNDSMRS